MHARSILPAVLLLLAPREAPGAEPPRDEWQYLDRHLSVVGFAEVQQPADGGIDASGNAFAIQSLPAGDRLVARSARFGRVVFRRPPAGGGPNAVACRGQEIAIRTKNVFNVLFTLGVSHHGASTDWIEFTFDDGTKGKGPFGLSDWGAEAILGEDVAFRLPVIGPWQPATGGAPLYLQRTPIPAAKRIVSIRLPHLPNAVIAGITLGWRETIAPTEPPRSTIAEPGLVAIFGEKGFPRLHSRADIEPEAIEAGLERAGIPASVLGLEHLRDGRTLTSQAYPVLVNPYGNTFPLEAEESLRAYRRSGGAMVHLGVPFTHPVVRSPYGGWIDRGHTGDYAPHDGDRGLGVGGFDSAGFAEFVGGPLLKEWGLDGVAWTRFFPTGPDLAPWAGANLQVLTRASLHPGDEVTPLITVRSREADPFAALIRHKGCPYEGAIDVRLGNIAVGLEQHEVPGKVAVELVVRSAAAILKEKGIVDEATWAKASAPIPESWRVPEVVEPVWPAPEADGRLPAARPVGRKVLSVAAGGLDDYEKALAASAQGLVNRSGGEASAFLVWGPREEQLLAWYQSEGLLDSVVPGDLSALLDLVGHRRCVLVDPDVRGSLNLAAMVAAAEGVLVAYPELVRRYALEVAADLRGLFALGADGYEWAWDGFRSKLSPSCLALVAPSASLHGLLDYIVAERIFALDWGPGPESEPRGASRGREVLVACRVLRSTPVGIPVLVAPAASFDANATILLSSHGKHRVSADGCSNLSFTSGLFPREGGVPAEGSPRPPGAPPPEGGPPEGALPGETVPRSARFLVAQVAPAPPRLDPLDLEVETVGAAPEAAAPAEVAADAARPAAVQNVQLRGGVVLRRLAIRPPALQIRAQARPRQPAPPARAPAPAPAPGGAAGEAAPAAPAEGGRGPIPGGTVLRLESYDLYPARAARAAAVDARERLGSHGLGEVDPAILGHVFGPEEARVKDLHWKLSDRRMAALGHEFLVLPGWRGPTSAEIAHCARALEHVRTILPAPRADLEIDPTSAAYLLEGKAVIHALKDPGAVEALALLQAPKVFAWVQAPAAERRRFGLRGLVELDPVSLGDAWKDWAEHGAPERVPLISEGSAWRYDDGGTDLGTAWRSPDHDDSSWKEGPAELGYGDATEGRPEATVISGGPDARNKFPCAYFRKSFDVARGTGWQSLSLEVVRDDGCAVYLNGKEVARSNLPEGDISFGTFASAAISSGDESSWQRFDVDPANIREGRNVIAVEMHQSGATSSDLSFDLRLTGYRARKEAASDAAVPGEPSSPPPTERAPPGGSGG